jgi:hypothetical protein
MVDQKDLDILQRINNELVKQVEFETKIARIRGEEVSDLDKQLDRLVKQQEVQANIEEILTETNREVRMAAIDLMEREAEVAKDKNQITETAYKNQLELAAELRKITNDSSDEAFRALKKRLKEQEKLNKSIEKQTRAMIAGQKAGAGMASSMSKFLGIAGEQETVFGQLTQSINVFDKGFKGAFKGATSALKGFGKEFGKNFNLASSLSFLFNTQVEVTLAFDMMYGQFQQNTGASERFMHGIERANDELARFGITLQDATEASQDLFTGFGLFTTLTEDARQPLVNLVSLLDQMGISGSTATKFLQTSVTELGLSIPEAVVQLRELDQSMRDMGMNTGEVVDTFNQLTPQLSIFGNKQKQVFMEAAKFAKGLGLNVNEGVNAITRLSNKLGTFEGAAQGVAALNISLGGSFVNAFDLAMAKSEGPLAQLKMMRDAIEASGKNLDDLGVREKEFLQEELGERFGLLQRLLQGDVLTEEDLKVEAAPTLEEAVQRSTSAQELLQAATEASTTELTKSTNELRNVKTKAANLVDAIGGLQYAIIGLGLLGTGANLFSAFQTGKIAKGMKGFLGGGGGDVARQASRMAAGDAILGRTMGTSGMAAIMSANRQRVLSTTNTFTPPTGSLKPISTAGSNIMTSKGMGLVGKTAGKGLGKSFIKKIPVIGALAGLGFGISRAMQGDFVGAGMEIASGGASLIPGAGTVASMGIDAALIARDMGAFGESPGSRGGKSSMMSGTTPASAQRIKQEQISTRAATQNSLLRQEISMLRKSLDNNVQAQANNKQPVKVDLYLDRSGTKKIAEASIDVLDNNYLSRGKVSNV